MLFVFIKFYYFTQTFHHGSMGITKSLKNLIFFLIMVVHESFHFNVSVHENLVSFFLFWFAAIRCWRIIFHIKNESTKVFQFFPQKYPSRSIFVDVFYLKNICFVRKLNLRRDLWLRQASATPWVAEKKDSTEKNCVAGFGIARSTTKENCCLRENFHSFLLCICTTIFSFLLSRICSRKIALYETFITIPQLRFVGGSFGRSSAKFVILGEKMENFLDVKLYDFVFSYERSEYAEQRKNWCEEKI